MAKRSVRYEVMARRIYTVIYDERGVLESIKWLYQFRGRPAYERFKDRWHGKGFMDCKRHSCMSFAYNNGFYAILTDMAGNEAYRTSLYETSMGAMAEGRAMCRVMEEAI